MEDSAGRVTAVFGDIELGRDKAMIDTATGERSPKILGYKVVRHATGNWSRPGTTIK
jgi:hypothetical protein